MWQARKLPGVGVRGVEVSDEPSWCIFRLEGEERVSQGTVSSVGDNSQPRFHGV